MKSRAAALLVCLAVHSWTAETGRETVVLSNPVAHVVLDLGGGAIGAFNFLDSDLNPLNWSTPKSGTSPTAYGHFLCLDRWGPPSESEGAQGMPYHGEASHVHWRIVGDKEDQRAEMKARLPKAGLSIRRVVRMSSQEAVFFVEEEIANENPLGRIYNAVQHPTIAPPFLDETTIVDCNGRRGFAQGGSLPSPEEPSAYWPNAINGDGQTVNVRYLNASADPNVVSYAIEGEYGWITAATPAKGLLLGYLWPKRDYPWVSVWRNVENGKPSARGLEFGTTGLHQPFPQLVEKGRIWDLPLFEYLDSRESRRKHYAAFLLKVPADFKGTTDIAFQKDGIVLRERSSKREFKIKLDESLPRF